MEDGQLSSHRTASRLTLSAGNFAMSPSIFRRRNFAAANYSSQYRRPVPYHRKGQRYVQDYSKAGRCDDLNKLQYVAPMRKRHRDFELEDLMWRLKKLKGIGISPKHHGSYTHYEGHSTEHGFQQSVNDDIIDESSNLSEVSTEECLSNCPLGIYAKQSMEKDIEPLHYPWA